MLPHELGNVDVREGVISRTVCKYVCSGKGGLTFALGRVVILAVALTSLFLEFVGA